VPVTGDPVGKVECRDVLGGLINESTGCLSHSGSPRHPSQPFSCQLRRERSAPVGGLDGSPLRRLVLDPTKDYQRIP